jgi:ABC-2 type transport system permease protein
MSETVFWNVFAFDRTATQVYFLLPVRFSRVLAGKNLASVVFVGLEIALITGACLALRLPVTVASIVEALAVSLVLSIYLLGVGNLVSVYFPRPANPDDPWGASGRKQRAFLLLPIFAVVLAPIGLAYLARYAFDSQAAFYGVLGFVALLGVAVYWIAMESAVAAAEAKKETFLQTLTGSDGPVVAN